MKTKIIITMETEDKQFESEYPKDLQKWLHEAIYDYFEITCILDDSAPDGIEDCILAVYNEEREPKINVNDDNAFYQLPRISLSVETEQARVN